MNKKNKWVWIDRENQSCGKNRIGMFDLTKGILMVGIIFGHCANDYLNLLLYNGGNNDLVRLLMSPLTLLRYGIVPMLFLSCGYGIRKQSVKKSIKNNLGMFWIPYVAVTLTILLLVLSKQVLLGGVLKQRLFYQVLPFLLGLHPGQHRLGNVMEQIGPIWFFLTYTLGCIYINFVLQEKQTWVQVLLIGSGNIVALMLTNVIVPFCFQQVLICSGYMYAGMWMKKGKVLEKKPPVYLLILTWVLCTVGTLAGGLVEIGSNFYRLGAMDLALSYLAGIVLLSLFQRIDLLQGKISEALRWIGRHMMWFCCFHTISYLMVPWKAIGMWFGEWKMAGFLFEFITSFLYAVTGCCVLDKVIKIVLYKKRKKEMNYEKTV